MATQVNATFATVEECFNRVYEQLREDNHENAPNSYTWFAQTLAQLAVEAGFDDDELLDGLEVDQIIGDQEADTIAWVYECNGKTLARITSWVSEAALIDFFGKCMGYDL